MSRATTESACPCGWRDARGQPQRYAQCCGLLLDAPDTLAARDAVALMRSRYTAFVLQRSDHLMRSWHPTRRPATLEFEPQARWLGLDVRRHAMLDDSHAEVEFVARRRGPDGRALRLHERSRFVHESGCWYYVDGEVLP